MSLCCHVITEWAFKLMPFVQLCMNAWTGKKEGKTCPVCRVIIQPEQLQRFTIEDQRTDLPPPPMLNNNEPAPRARREILYNKIGTLIEDIFSPTATHSLQIPNCSKISRLWNHSEATAVKYKPSSAISCSYRSPSPVLRVLFSQHGLILYTVSPL
jgi:hypothetical protein